MAYLETPIRPKFDCDFSWLNSGHIEPCLMVEREGNPPFWTHEEFISTIRHSEVHGRVAELASGKVIGFVVYGMEMERVQILNLVIHPDYRRKEIATRFVEGIASRSPGKTIWAIVNERHTDVHLFLRFLKFRATKVVRNFGKTGAAGYVFERSGSSSGD